MKILGVWDPLPGEPPWACSLDPGPPEADPTHSQGLTPPTSHFMKIPTPEMGVGVSCFGVVG